MEDSKNRYAPFKSRLAEIALADVNLLRLMLTDYTSLESNLTNFWLLKLVFIDRDLGPLPHAIGLVKLKTIPRYKLFRLIFFPFQNI